MKNHAWLALRGQLNHDWLQNRYLTFLSARQTSLDGRGLADQELRSRLLEWRSKRDHFETLIRSIEEALSPRQLLDERPLKEMPAETKAWLGPLIHELYCIRSGIRETTARLAGKVAEVDALVTTLTERHGNRGAAEHLYQACQELSQTISELPSTVQVI
ncbi:MAG: hypothetical protein MN733_20960 [Nitrososphaera sp.]|nr:hypothetical protein [Nitrososphaera sp.]